MVSQFKTEILQLKEAGQSHAEISRLLNCAKSTVSWHCNSEHRKKSYAARSRAKQKLRVKLKMLFGGKCRICGYERCLNALQFHHRDPRNKTRLRLPNRGIYNVMALLWRKGWEFAVNEARKCILLCANCHFEVHHGITKLPD